MTAMTMPPGCDEFARQFADFLDGDLPDAARVAMESHASDCAACRRLLSDIDALRRDAAALPLLAPSRDLWSGIAERIDARVLPLAAPRVAFGRRTWRHRAVAAAALVLFTAGVTHLWTRASYDAPARVSAATPRIARGPVVIPPTRQRPDTTTGATRVASSGRPDEVRAVRPDGAPRAPGERAVAPPPVTLVNRPLTAGRIMRTEVEPVYDREMVTLRAIVRERRAQLDPGTVAVLEQSIAVIDSAIAQSRAALARDPASGFLAARLNHSLEKKVELLRTAALLPART